jgi:protein-L-isoaspartate(D-aspartate) O-methyltransferase
VRSGLRAALATVDWMSAADLANRVMVDDLVRRGLVGRGTAIEAAFRAIRRDRFLPATPLDEVFRADIAVLTHQQDDGEGVSSSSAPSMMAIMLRQLDVRPGHRVLEVGAGTGYNAAVLARLVGPTGGVTTIDVDGAIADEARASLDAAGIGGVDVRAADGWDGAPDAAPFDRVIVTVGVADLSPAWVAQLAGDGPIVAPIWLRNGLQLSLPMARVDAVGQRLRGTGGVPCGFMRFRGEHAAGPETLMLDDGWACAAPAGGPDAAATLRRLHVALADIGPAPAGAPGWFSRLAVDGRGVRIWRAGASRLGSREGMFDQHDPSLAVVERGRLFAAGGSRATELLRGCLAAREPFDVAQVVVDAIPSAETDSAWLPSGVDAGAAVERRPSFTFVLRAR